MLGVVLWFLLRLFFWYRDMAEARAAAEARQAAIERVIAAHQEDAGPIDEADLFGEDNMFRILLLGLDNRVGQEHGHCDAIQMMTIDKTHEHVVITAVPRGTYSPLPPGKGTTSTDYYVSNACGLGGLEYGIAQIERILGAKADAIVTVGFSELFGILRTLELPTTETVQWLRHRQSYQIGEPQRARNHSTFLKHVLVTYLPSDASATQTALLHVLYNMVQTNLSFAQVKTLTEALADLDLAANPDRIQLAMRPAYAVSDIPYDPQHVGEEVQGRIDSIARFLSAQSYTGLDAEAVQKNLLDQIEKEKDDPTFIVWAFEHHLWLQIHDPAVAEELRFDLMQRYLSELETAEEREAVLSAYIVEMRNRGEAAWEQKGIDALGALIGE